MRLQEIPGYEWETDTEPFHSSYGWFTPGRKDEHWGVPPEIQSILQEIQNRGSTPTARRHSTPRKDEEIEGDTADTEDSISWGQWLNHGKNPRSSLFFACYRT
jgi:hypothetical protein